MVGLAPPTPVASPAPTTGHARRDAQRVCDGGASHAAQPPRWLRKASCRRWCSLRRSLRLRPLACPSTPLRRSSSRGPKMTDSIEFKRPSRAPLAIAPASLGGRNRCLPRARKGKEHRRLPQLPWPPKSPADRHSAASAGRGTRASPPAASRADPCSYQGSRAGEGSGCPTSLHPPPSPARHRRPRAPQGPARPQAATSRAQAGQTRNTRRSQAAEVSCKTSPF